MRYATGRSKMFRTIQPGGALFLALALLVIILWAISARAVEPVNQEEYNTFTQAQKAMDNQALPKAERLLERYFRRNAKRHPLGYELYGYVLMHSGKPEQAVDVLEEGFSAYPHNAVIAQNLGAACARTGSNRRAAEAFMAAYSLSHAKKPQLAYSAALFLLRANAPGEAADLLEPLLGHPEARPEWFLLLGKCGLQQEDYASALHVLQAGVKRFPEKNCLWRMLGFTQYKKGDTKRAVASYEIAHRLSPPCPKRAAQLAALHCSIGSPLLGKKAVEGINADAGLLDSLAYGLAQSGDLKSALEKAEQAIDLSPSTERLFRKAEILIRMGRMEQARSTLAPIADEKGPQQGKALWTLAMIAWTEGDLKEAYGILGKNIRVDASLEKRARPLMAIMDSTISEADDES